MLAYAQSDSGKTQKTMVTVIASRKDNQIADRQLWEGRFTFCCISFLKKFCTLFALPIQTNKRNALFKNYIWLVSKRGSPFYPVQDVQYMPQKNNQ